MSDLLNLTQWASHPLYDAPFAWRTNRPCESVAVHPHLRGDHISKGVLWSCANGSSPPAWGPHSLVFFVVAPVRFILTCVGTTKHIVAHHDIKSVHPHLRGDHLFVALFSVVDNGSSPPAWGPLLLRHYRLFALRFIPTWVGTTLQRPFLLCAVSVHPHLRGDHFHESSAKLCRYGSSPPAWGPRDHWQGWLTRHRFIPTCVGTTP